MRRHRNMYAHQLVLHYDPQEDDAGWESELLDDTEPSFVRDNQRPIVRGTLNIETSSPNGGNGHVIKTWGQSHRCHKCYQGTVKLENRKNILLFGDILPCLFVTCLQREQCVIKLLYWMSSKSCPPLLHIILMKFWSDKQSQQCQISPKLISLIQFRHILCSFTLDGFLSSPLDRDQTERQAYSYSWLKSTDHYDLNLQWYLIWLCGGFICTFLIAFSFFVPQ